MILKHCNTMTELPSKLDSMIIEMKQRAPRDADEWINSFVALADRFPACIVITDMTIAGAPMIFVNRGKHNTFNRFFFNYTSFCSTFTVLPCFI